MSAKWHPKRFPNQSKRDPKTKPENMMKIGSKMAPKWGPWESRVRPKGHPWAALGRLGSPWGGLGGPTGGQKWHQKALQVKSGLLLRFSGRFPLVRGTISIRCSGLLLRFSSRFPLVQGTISTRFSRLMLRFSGRFPLVRGVISTRFFSKSDIPDIRAKPKQSAGLWRFRLSRIPFLLD